MSEKKEIVSQADFAKRINKSRARVSQMIIEGKLNVSEIIGRKAILLDQKAINLIKELN
jgi:predicted DNA-binding protein (UPF0251 family)